MFYRKYKPNKSHRRIVECYFIWKGIVAEPITIESPPNAFTSIVFNFKEPYKISTTKYSEKTVPRSFVCGQAIRNYTLHINGEIGMAGIVFKPAGLYHFLGHPMYDFTGERVAIKHCMPRHYQQYEDLIKLADTNKDIVTLLQSMVEDLMSTGTNGTPEIIYAANEIVDSHGDIQIDELCEKLFMSRRTFERKFLEEVGVSPKAYARLRRFGYTCSLMAGKSDIKLSDIFYRAGYYDQSHFIKDFKYYSGRSPRLYMKTNTELANYVRDALKPQKAHSRY